MLNIGVLNKLNRSGKIDIAKYNDYLYPISPDLMIRTMNDLFIAGIIGCNGQYIKSSTVSKVITYAKLAYYILKMPLFKAIMTAYINTFKLPNVYTITDVNNHLFSMSIDECIDTNYKKAAEFIPQGRKLFVDIITGKSKFIVPYRNDLY